MRSPNSGGSFYEGPTVIEAMDRLELNRDLSRRHEEAAHKDITSCINGDPSLHSMLSKLVESGPELSTEIRSHLKRMIALRLGVLRDIRNRTVSDKNFFNIALAEVSNDLEELAAYEGQVADMPDMWDMALQDLLRLGDEN